MSRVRLAALVGSAAWLLQHELRLAWRGIGLRHRWSAGIAVGLLWLAGHAAAYAWLHEMRHAGTPPSVIPMVGGFTVMVMSLMLSQAVLLSVSVLFVRGDLDLLLSSPVPARSVFMVRGLEVAASSCVLYLALCSPVADIGVLTGRPGLLAIYPTLVGLALAMTALGMLLTLWLVRLLGARRARTGAQLLGAFVGASIFLATQGQNMLDDDRQHRLAQLLAHWAEPGGPLSPDSLCWLPGRAMLGETGPLLWVIGLGASSFWLVMALAHRSFVAGARESLHESAPRVLAGTGSGPARMRAGVSLNVMIKEWRLIRRDPQLISQALLQTLYLLPLMFLAFRHHDAMAVVVPGAVLFGTSLAGSLAWITVAAEEAPELIVTAPVDLNRIRRLKVLAALAPVWAMLSPLLVLLLVNDMRLALVFLFCALGGTLSAGTMQLACPRRGDRREMNKRVQGGVLIGLVETFNGIAWAATAYCLISAWQYLPLALLPALLGPAAAWWLGKARRDQNQLV